MNSGVSCYTYYLCCMYMYVYIIFYACLSSAVLAFCIPALLLFLLSSSSLINEKTRFERIEIIQNNKKILIIRGAGIQRKRKK